MSKLTGSRVLKRVSAKKTALYNAMGRRHGSIHYRNIRSNSRQSSSSNATLLWYALNALLKRKQRKLGAAFPRTTCENKTQ